MKTHSNLRGKICLALSLSLVSGCAALSRRGSSSGNESSRPNLTEEVRLKEDRTQLEELRKNVEPEVKQENDELAYILKLLHDGGGDDAPEKIRDRFSREVRKRRDLFERGTRSARQDFDRNEKKKREEFLAKQKSEREDFSSSKPKADERQKFFNDLETDRRNFFSAEREAREDFESRSREKRREFDDYIRGTQARFDQEMRDYSRSYHENRLKKEKERTERLHRPTGASPTGVSANGGLETQARPPVPHSAPQRAQAVDPDLAEFDRIPSGPRIPLQTEPTGN